MNDFPELTDDETAERLEVSGERASSRSYFSLTRLVIVTIASPTPIWAVPTEHDAGRKALLVSAMAIAVTVLIVRARDLPRVNLTAVLFLLCEFVVESFVDRANTIPGFCFNSILATIPAVLYTHCIYPSRNEKGLPAAALKVKSVLRTGLAPFFVLGAIQLGLAAWVLLGENQDVYQRAMMILVIAVFIVLLAFNLYSLWGKLPESLDERPDLGYLYQATTILIPLATWIFVVRMLGIELH